MPFVNVNSVNSAEFTVRRATVEDLDGLKQLWGQAGLPILDLERRLTEFQVVISPEGEVVGAIGLQIAAKHGRLHTEVYRQTDLQEQFRPQVWLRIQNIARNHGLTRLWMREEEPFWQQQGFSPPNEAAFKKFSEDFGPKDAKWSTLQLREENLEAITLEKEFELFQQSQRDSTEKLLGQARIFKYIAYVILVLAVAVVAFFMIKVFKHFPPSRLFGR